MMIKAVIFDLDDTLYPETDYVKSGFCAIAKELGDSRIADKLYGLFSADSENVYQRAGFSKEECIRCIDIYRNHCPSIHLTAEVKNLLGKLKQSGYKLGIITDGNPKRQKRKIDALGLDSIMDLIIITDELGGIEYRKPNPMSFEQMKDFFGIEFNEMIYVGDNPEKDFYIGSIYPITTVRLLNHSSIYFGRDYKCGVKEGYKIENLTDLTDLINKL